MKPMRFAIIGCGVIGKAHAAILQEMPDAELVAVSDEVEALGKVLAEKTGAAYYPDYREMLERSDIDIVTIATPSGMHGAHAIACANAGKHAIVEKPIEITLEKADEIIRIFAEKGLKLSSVSQTRFSRDIQRVKKLIEAGKFGRLIMGTTAVHWYRSQQYYDSGDWRGTWALDGGGALMNQAIHRIDLLQYLMGPVRSVHAQCDTLGHERIEVEDVAVASVRFTNGAVGSITATTCAYPGLKTRIEIIGENGTAVFENEQITQLSFKDEETETDTAGGGADGASSDPSVLSSSSHRPQFEDMIAAVRENREPAVNGEQGRLPLEIIIGIYRSSQSGQTVTLPIVTGGAGS
ncbi:Gfo/Idh/MocA family protein [Paenibacillus contaminans]|uniref:Gfo/Idh/MocA family oxidoreductase n=1 Tax=Paenibacillus contaminans TaxID=450362 RepID=A0A329MPD1_9BACL|nr:Gfo/Idh/MocA family oxidoreductase [Paenibacillus contaminans]RAV21769.1 gfo/Idh/MocA family oxidoreductase [Paenibacillus contaminans]